MATARLAFDPSSGFGAMPPGQIPRVPAQATPPQGGPPIVNPAGTPASQTTARIPPTAQPMSPAAMLETSPAPQPAPPAMLAQPNPLIEEGPNPQGPIVSENPPYSNGGIGTPYPNTGVAGGGNTWAVADYSNPANITAYFQSRGITDPNQLARLTSDWTGYYNQFGRSDPEYFFRRMEQEDDLIGGPQNSPFRENPTPPGGALGNITPSGPNSNLYESTLAKLINEGGLTASGRSLQEKLNALMAAGGQTEPVQRQLVQAREDVGNAFQGQLADVRDQLAARGIVSQPGQGQGIEGDATSRLAQALQPGYTKAITDIETHASDLANSNVIDAFSIASGLSKEEASNILQAVGVGTTREQMFANVALQQLSENRQWNQFLASYGLSREQLANSIQSGQIDQLIELLRLFMTGAGVAAGGTVGE